MSEENPPIRPSNPAPALIGMFDSGVGGLSVMNAVHSQWPAHPILYLADQAHVPYGERTLEEVRAFSREITRFLLRSGARLIVVACNTASAAALHFLRQEFPRVCFVGMEPAVKPAAEHTTTGRIGVLATPATFQGELYQSLVARFASNVRIFQHTCPGLVGQIEAGNLEGAETRSILEDAILPMLKNNIDSLVLGCTHYPFVIPLINSILTEHATHPVNIIDPAPAVARQAGRVLASNRWLVETGSPAPISYFTTGSVDDFQEILPLLRSVTAPVFPASWGKNGRLVKARMAVHKKPQPPGLNGISS